MLPLGLTATDLSSSSLKVSCLWEDPSEAIEKTSATGPAASYER